MASVRRCQNHQATARNEYLSRSRYAIDGEMRTAGRFQTALRRTVPAVICGAISLRISKANLTSPVADDLPR